MRKGERARSDNLDPIYGGLRGKIFLQRSVLRLNYQCPWLARSEVTIGDYGYQNGERKEEKISCYWALLPARPQLRKLELPIVLTIEQVASLLSRLCASSARCYASARRASYLLSPQEICPPRLNVTEIIFAPEKCTAIPPFIPVTKAAASRQP